jgi:hypothetical protein
MRGLVFTAQFMFVILALSTIRPDLSVETGLPASAVA